MTELFEKAHIEKAEELIEEIREFYIKRGYPAISGEAESTAVTVAAIAAGRLCPGYDGDMNNLAMGFAQMAHAGFNAGLRAREGGEAYVGGENFILKNVEERDEAENSVAPIVINFLIECHVTEKPGTNIWPGGWDSPAGIDVRAWLQSEGLVTDEYRPTDRGKAWLNAILSTPLPPMPGNGNG